MDSSKVKELKYKHPSRPINTAVKLATEDDMLQFCTAAGKSKLRTTQWALFFTHVTTQPVVCWLFFFGLVIVELFVCWLFVGIWPSLALGLSLAHRLLAGSSGTGTLAGTLNRRTDWQAATPVTALIQRTSEPDDFLVYEPPLSFDALTDSKADVLPSVPGRRIMPVASTPQEALEGMMNVLRAQFMTENAKDVELRCDRMMLKVWAHCVINQPNVTINFEGIDRLFDSGVCNKGKGRLWEPEGRLDGDWDGGRRSDECDRFKLMELVLKHQITPAALHYMPVEALLDMGMPAGHAYHIIAIATR
ncbi:hypothetical protein DFJ73DRAFT_944653 [Zopfochytrium polystomum]|nr:hypothetical protein DFJ73DRAFT_944653 [Zopfochytrium polystomum]